ncbi:MAG: hypothetical protein Q8K65_10695 [Alphaproteobacteria bacterium]|nr:hypothetical protein [Alphaproteobacteria bacterium]
MTLSPKGAVRPRNFRSVKTGFGTGQTAPYRKTTLHPFPACQHRAVVNRQNGLQHDVIQPQTQPIHVFFVDFCTINQYVREILADYDKNMARAL